MYLVRVRDNRAKLLEHQVSFLAEHWKTIADFALAKPSSRLAHVLGVVINDSTIDTTTDLCVAAVDNFLAR